MFGIITAKEGRLLTDEANQRITSIGREIQTSLLPGDRFGRSQWLGLALSFAGMIVA